MAVARVRMRVVASAMKVAVVAVGREMAVAVVMELAVVVVVEVMVTVVVEVVVKVEVMAAGGVPFGPPNEIKSKSMLDNMLVHLILSLV